MQINVCNNGRETLQVAVKEAPSHAREYRMYTSHINTLTTPKMAGRKRSSEGGKRGENFANSIVSKKCSKTVSIFFVNKVFSFKSRQAGLADDHCMSASPCLWARVCGPVSVGPCLWAHVCGPMSAPPLPSGQARSAGEHDQGAGGIDQVTREKKKE